MASIDGCHTAVAHRFPLQRIAQQSTSRLQSSVVSPSSLVYPHSAAASGSQAPRSLTSCASLTHGLTRGYECQSGGVCCLCKLPGLGATPPLAHVCVPRRRANHSWRLGSWVSLHLARPNCPVAGEQRCRCCSVSSRLAAREATFDDRCWGRAPPCTLPAEPSVHSPETGASHFPPAPRWELQCPS